MEPCGVSMRARYATNLRSATQIQPKIRLLLRMSTDVMKFTAKNKSFHTMPHTDVSPHITMKKQRKMKQLEWSG